ncbi:hypothetical protein OG746_40185 [Streptomyces sp. NBC_01016]|nr:hypothetical protein [Streptomyces sp. NBC_01016]MCX4834922.1 hypothetical protein [Streptomyces sp. NBC_01016]
MSAPTPSDSLLEQAPPGLPGCVGDDPDLVAHVRDRDGILIPGMNG